MTFKQGDRVLFDLFNGQNEITKDLYVFIGLVVNDNKNGTYDIIYIRGHNELKTAKNIIDRFVMPIEVLRIERERIRRSYNDLLKLEEKSFVTHKRLKEINILRDSIINRISDNKVEEIFEKLEKYFAKEREK